MYLYGIGVRGHFVKFGVAGNVRQRWADLQVACPIDLEILATLETPKRSAAFELENLVHQAMKAHILRGEWFTFCENTNTIIRGMELFSYGVFRKRVLKMIESDPDRGAGKTAKDYFISRDRDIIGYRRRRA